MTHVHSPKKYPNASAEVSQLLGFDKADEHASNAVHTKTAHEPPDLPVVDSHAITSTPTVTEKKNLKADSAHDAKIPTIENHSELETIEEAAAKQPVWKKVLKSIAPYFAVFLVGLILYYFFLSKTDFPALFNNFKLPAKVSQTTPKETALQTLMAQNLNAYRTWIAQYYFDVSDVSVIDPNADNSGNGLSNFQKFLLNLNPRDYDTLGLGMADSQALAQGINPVTGSPLNSKQKEIVDKYFDMEVIMNRLALSQLNNSRNVAGAAVNNNQTQSFQTSDTVNARGNSNTQTLNSVNTNAGQNNTYVAPKTGADIAMNNYLTDGSNIDQTRPGFLEIPSLNVKVPVIWTQNPKTFDTDLQSGTVHYPGTALPGQIGTTYISGHSSNYAWAKGDYNKIFSHLGDLADNSSFIITVYTTDNKTIKYHYVVTHRAEYKATDPAQFQNSSTSTVALSTCWPVNTTQKRLVVFGELTQTEK